VYSDSSLVHGLNQEETSVVIVEQGQSSIVLSLEVSVEIGEQSCRNEDLVIDIGKSFDSFSSSAGIVILGGDHMSSEILPYIGLNHAGTSVFTVENRHKSLVFCTRGSEALGEK